MIQLQERVSNRKAKAILAYILQRGVVSKQELLESSQMTVSTVTRLLEELTGLSVIEEAGFGESTGGRKPILYKPNPRYGYIYGLEISRIHSRLMLFDMELNRIDSKRWDMTEEMTPERLMAEVADSIQKLSAKHKIERSRLLGLGIGAVGPLDRSSGAILEPLYFPAPGWKNIPIRQTLEEKLDIPVLLDNGANTALIGEYHKSPDKQVQHLLYVHAGVGLRSAMMSNGQIVYGAVDMEGAVGQMIIQTDGRRPREAWGNFGSLESYATTYALEQQARSLMKQGRQTVLREYTRDPETITFAHLVQALERKDPMVIELFTQSATYFGIGLANLLNILHPERVILGGPLINSHPLYFQAATEVAVKNTYYYPHYSVLFGRGTLGDEALVTGAAAMAVDALTELG